MLRNSEAALVAALALSACAELPPDYLGASGDYERQLQTRRFEGVSEQQVLAASVAVLQDLGFTMETKGSALGFVQGTKDREAKAPEQKLGLITLAILIAATSQGRGSVPAEAMREDQTIEVLLCTRPAQQGDSSDQLVRVTFHSHLRQPMSRTAGPLRDPLLYSSFFELLSRALFLEAQQL